MIGTAERAAAEGYKVLDQESAGPSPSPSTSLRQQLDEARRQERAAAEGVRRVHQEIASARSPWRAAALPSRLAASPPPGAASDLPTSRGDARPPPPPGTITWTAEDGGATRGTTPPPEDEDEHEQGGSPSLREQLEEAKRRERAAADGVKRLHAEIAEGLHSAARDSPTGHRLASDGAPGAVDRDTRTEVPDDELEPVLSRSARADEHSEPSSDFVRAVSARKRLLFLCASNVPEPEVLLNAVDPWVTCVQYDFDQPLEQDSLRWIGAAAQRSANLQAVCERFEHVALALHGGEPGAIELTSTTAVTEATAEAPEVAAFMQGLAKLLADGGRIDVLGCSVAESPEGTRLIARLESLYGVNVAASTDITHAGDMVLETDDVDVTALYFNRDRLSRWGGKLGGEHSGEFCICPACCPDRCESCWRSCPLPVRIGLCSLPVCACVLVCLAIVAVILFVNAFMESA